MEQDFLDSNIALYAFQDDDPSKRDVATRLLEEGILEGMTISAQVLAEVANTLLRGREKGNPVRVRAAIEALTPFRMVLPDADIVKRAVEAHARYGIHFYDGMIVAAAERAGCSRIWSEDLNPGQSYFGVRVENPF